MNAQLTCTLISMTIFLSYVLFISFRYGVQSSISTSYYRLPKQFQFLFTLVFWGFSIPMIIAGNTALMFFASASICFVGAAPNFKDVRLERKVHVLHAIFGICFMLLSIVFDFKQYLIATAFVLSSILFLAFNVKNKTWWIEVFAYVSILATLLIHNL